MRAIDHLVVPCADLAVSAAGFERLGFQVGRRNRHPWGTENHVIQFGGAFLELIAPASDFRPLDPQDDAFPFAGFLAGQGGSADPSGMIVLRSADAQADAGDFAARGIGTGRRLRFSREAATPEGGRRTVAFTLAFADAPGLPDLGFFVCQQHYPENFWNPAFQLHPNGVTRIAAVIIVTEDPARHAAFLRAFVGQGEADTEAGVVAIDTSGGNIEAMTAERYAARYGATLPQPRSATACIAAIRFDTLDLAAVPRLIEEGGATPVACPGGWVVRPPEPGQPALVFGPEA